jgi:hypothetical protein
MRGGRLIACALAALILGACGSSTNNAEEAAARQASTTTEFPTNAVTVHLGRDPRLAPVERLLSASKNVFDAGLFLSAFDISDQPCDIRAVAERVDGSNTDPPINLGNVHVASVRNIGNAAAVTLRGAQPYFIRVRRIGAQWLVDEDACLWVGEVQGGDLRSTDAKGLAELTAADPRRAAPHALIASLVHGFDAPLFLSAFDLSNQPCDARGLANAASRNGSGGFGTISPRYFVRPIGAQDAGVMMSSGGSAIALRIHKFGSTWKLDENACTWLSTLTGLGSAQTRAQDAAAESDLRNALTAEKTTYTDVQQYSASSATMRQIEPALDWGGRLQFEVGDVVAGDHNIVCLSERSKSGKRFLIADIANGAEAGTYYAAQSCPSPLDAATIAAFGRAGWGS